MDIELIQRVPLFAKLPLAEIERLTSVLQTRDFQAQDLLLYEGNMDQRCFILLEGQVEIVKALGTADERILDTCPAGVLLGEMSLFDSQKRHSASVRALSPGKTLEMTQRDLDQLLERQPQLAYEIVRVMCQRLDHADNATIIDLREKNRELSQAYQELKEAQAQIIAKEKLEKELEIARRIQKSILPQAFPVLDGFDCGALMLPARAVGGDFYDFIPLPGKRIGIVVGDVSDKGVPAALFMALTYSLLRAEAARYESAGEVIRNANRLLNQINSSGMFVTLVFGTFDPASRSFTYARAGHPDPVILDSSGLRLAASGDTGQVLGLYRDPLLDEQSVTVPEGGLVALYSDGVTEAVDPQGEEFGEERLVEALTACCQAGAQEICNRIWEEVRTFTSGLPRMDDFTILVVKARP